MVWRNAGFPVAAVGGQGAGDGATISPAIGQFAAVGQSESASRAVAHKGNGVIGLAAEGKEGSGAITTSVNKYYNGTRPQQGGVAGRSFDRYRVAEVVMRRSVLDLRTIDCTFG